ncbi:MAG: hypothetical protein C0506_15625 [Anaerolinea sp.]|nr:hypothetical protein [Anaerolinea sp.]
MVVITDSSVWIDYLAGRSSPATASLAAQLSSEIVAIGDLVMMEVLRGLNEQQARQLEQQLGVLSLRPMADPVVVLRSARNYRLLRARGFTIRSAVDCLIATYCIDGGHTLLHSDRDFDPFEQHLGLRVLHP